MAGRPMNKRFIVDVVDVIDLAAILEIKLTYRDLCESSSSTELALEFLARNRLIQNSLNCLVCGDACTLVRANDKIDGFEWYVSSWVSVQGQHQKKFLFFEISIDLENYIGRHVCLLLK